MCYRDPTRRPNSPPLSPLLSRSPRADVMGGNTSTEIASHWGPNSEHLNYTTKWVGEEVSDTTMKKLDTMNESITEKSAPGLDGAPTQAGGDASPKQSGTGIGDGNGRADGVSSRRDEVAVETNQATDFGDVAAPRANTNEGEETVVKTLVGSSLVESGEESEQVTSDEDTDNHDGEEDAEMEIEDRRTQFQVKMMEGKVDKLDTITKKKNLILEGIPEIEGRREITEKTVEDLFDQLGVDKGINYESCFRVGPFIASKPRPILVGFHKQSDRDLIYAKRFDLKKTRDYQRVWINEDLGPAEKRKRGIIRLISREAQQQGVDCKTGKFALQIGGDKYDENNLSDLPPPLQPTSLKQVMVAKNQLAYQSEFAPFSNFFPCQIKVGIHTFSAWSRRFSSSGRKP